MRNEKGENVFGRTQLWHAVLYSCRGSLQPIFVTRSIVQRYFSYFKKRRYFAFKAHTKKTDMPAIVASSNKVQRKIKQAKNRKKRKFLRCFKWGLTFVACGTAVVRDAFTAIVLTRHSTSLRYTFASLKSNELYEKRCHVKCGRLTASITRTGRICRRYLDMRTRITTQQQFALKCFRKRRHPNDVHVLIYSGMLAL